MTEESSVTFQAGTWIRWTTPWAVKEGQIALASGPSLVVKWLGGVEQVFPTYHGYVAPDASSAYRMEAIPRPPRASQIARDESRGVISVQRAAAILGTSPKRVRAQLRAGILEGTMRDGKWIEVRL